MKKIGNILFLIVFISLFLSCKKEETKINPIPEIHFVNISKTTVKEFEENLVITLNYKDENGDLGSLDPDDFPLEVLDSRLTEPDLYYVPPLSPIGSDIYIEGEIDITLNSPFLLGNGGDEKVIYTIRLRDREGNSSNIITTPEITITK